MIHLKNSGTSNLRKTDSPQLSCYHLNSANLLFNLNHFTDVLFVLVGVVGGGDWGGYGGRRVAGCNVNQRPHAGFWGSDVHCRRSQPLLCLPPSFSFSSSSHPSVSPPRLYPLLPQGFAPPAMILALASSECLPFPVCVSEIDLNARPNRHGGRH